MPRFGTTSHKMGLVDELLNGNRRALARLATYVENQDDLGRAALVRIYPHTGSAHVVGITGAPGAGKSTLIDALISEIRATKRSVAVIAVDPTSPFTGGATLGDRIRMRERPNDDNVFVRSMASRGRRGGLAPSTMGLVHLADAAGFDLVLVETVGVGQEEIDVSFAVHTAVVLQVPGLGDGVQTIKAGLLEVGDVYVVNKADRDGAEALLRDLRTLIGPDRTRQDRGWARRILKAAATNGMGISDVLAAIDDHLRYLKESGEFKQLVHEMARQEVTAIARFQLERRLIGDRLSDAVARVAQHLIDDVANRRVSPEDAANQILRTWQ